MIFELDITLEGIAPRVWRRVRVPAHVTLARLHDVIQAVMGWEDCHLHHFLSEGVEYGDPELLEEWDDRGVRDEARTRVSDVLSRRGEVLVYEYDFGDGWEHTIRLRRVLTVEDAAVDAPGASPDEPVCVAGARACPPEDCGGAIGYYSMLEALGDPDHPEHEMWREWVPDSFDPEAFDVDAANLALRRGPFPTAAPEVVDALVRPVTDALERACADRDDLPDEVVILARESLVIFAALHPERLAAARKPETWAAGALHTAWIVYRRGYGRGRMTLAEVAALFGVSTASVSVRSLELREALEAARDAGMGDLVLEVDDEDSTPLVRLGLGFKGINPEDSRELLLTQLRTVAAPGNGREASGVRAHGIASDADADDLDDSAALAALRTPAGDPELKDRIARRVLVQLAGSASPQEFAEAPRSAIAALAWLAFRRALSGLPLLLALDLTLRDHESLGAATADELRPVWQALSGEEMLGEPGQVRMLHGLLEAAGWARKGRLAVELVDAIAGDDALPLPLRRSVLAGATDPAASPTGFVPFLPARARRAALARLAGMEDDPDGAATRLLERAEAERSEDHWVAAGDFLAEHGERITRDRLEALVRRGLGAHYAAARQAFFRAGLRHLGEAAWQWAPRDVLERAGRSAQRGGGAGAGGTGASPDAHNGPQISLV